MKVLSFLLREFRGVFILAVIGGVLSGGASTALLALVNSAINEDGANRTILGLAFGGLCVVFAVTRVSSHLLQVRLAEHTVLKVRLDLVRKLLATPLAKIEAIGTARVVAAVTEDTASIANALVILPLLSVNILMVVCSLVYLGWLSIQVLLGFVVVMAVAGVSYIIPVQEARRRYRTAFETQDELFRQFRFLTEGSKELKLHAGRRHAFIATIERTATSLRDQYISGATVAGIAQAWGQLLVFFLVGCVIFVLPQVQPIDRETLTGYTLVLFYIMAPFQLMLQSTHVLGRGSVALEHVAKMGLSLDRLEEAGEVPAPSSWRRLELSGVTYRYHRTVADDGFAIGPIDLAFGPGEVVFIVGGNGSGKTTLAKIISGLYSPDAGEIRVDGRTVTEDARDTYRQFFSAVFSDFCLFESLLGLDATDLDEQARRYMMKLHLDKRVGVKDGVLSTVSLSHGQRKRLALLTAYLEDRPIYIFDEWAADQDPIFKQVFYHQFLGELKARGKTVLVISHDDRYFHVADRVVKLEEGQLRAYEDIRSTVSA